MNCRHRNFQSRALPTELPRQKERADRQPSKTERAMRFELTTFSLARRRSTAELRPQNDEAMMRGWPGRRPKRWTRSDSNRRSPPCKGGAFPLGHGPAPGDHGADERTRTSTTFRSTDPKSVASANSATSAHVGTILIRRINGSTPDSVRSRHLSHTLADVVAPGLPGVTRPRRRHCDETKPERAWPTRLAPGCTLA